MSSPGEFAQMSDELKKKKRGGIGRQTRPRRAGSQRLISPAWDY
jgi:hypothetical protein